MDINEIAYAVNGAVFEVNRVIGPGFLDKKNDFRLVRRACDLILGQVGHGFVCGSLRVSAAETKIFLIKTVEPYYP